MPAKTEVTTSTIPCDWPDCTRTFHSEHAKNVHKVRAHIKPWNTTRNLPIKRKTLKNRNGNWVMTPEYRRQKYRETVDRYHAQGLNAHGQPFKKNPDGKLSAKGRANIAKAQRKRRAREKGQLPVVSASTNQSPTDNLGDTARAIMLAAQVLRSVSLGLKL